MIRDKLLIAFDGTNAAGKTTLIYSVASRLKEQGLNCEVLVEPARNSPTADAILLYNQGSFDMPAQLELFALHIVQCVRATKNSTLIISDRTPISTMAYNDMLITNRTKHEEDLINVAESFTDVWTSYYDIIFYCQDYFVSTQEDDKIRKGDDEFQKTLDAKTRQLYEKAGANLVYIPKGLSLTERTDFVINELKKARGL
ncbi:MAG: AAA family ATPase [Defluviitaleaceae bacterium]|nr:AAA family ATPase [Defluviitaleaceae bacterium]